VEKGAPLGEVLALVSNIRLIWKCLPETNGPTLAYLAFSSDTKRLNAECHYTECRYAESHYALSVVMLNVVMLSVVAPLSTA
jgi:hypothetical protein